MKHLNDIDTEIVRLLKEDSFVSGEEISDILHLSRSAVWKRINGLRQGGYAIEARPRKGYRLSSSKTPYTGVAISSALKTETIGHPLHFHNTLDSTNTRARELAGDGAAEGTTVIADSQTLGRGRRGREWHSPVGLNLYTSVILRPDIAPERAPTITLLAAVALAEAIEETLKESSTPMRPTVKWPNDILVGGKKVAGILTEMSSEPDKIHHIIVGMGVNLNLEAKALPSELREIATSLKDCSGEVVDRADFTARLYSSLEKWYTLCLLQGSGNFGPAIDMWRGYFDRVGTHVKVSTTGEEVSQEGTCMGIDDDGALLIKNSKGAVERVVSGDVN